MEETEVFGMKVAVMNAVWCLPGTERIIIAESELYENVLVSGSVSLVTEDVQRLGNHV